MKWQRFFLLLPILFFLSLSLIAQKKTSLVEHFTNSRCPICAVNNPGFYARYDKYKEDVIHISYHPSIPYNDCIFYLANKEGNGARQTLYELIGTPTAFLNGKKGASSLPSDAEYQNAISQKAKYDLTINSASPDKVDLTITTLENLPNGASLRLFVALSENEVLYNAPNGETKHINVFRKFLGDQNYGIVVNFPVGSTANSAKSLSLGAINYSGVNDWSQFSLIAFINLDSDKEILQATKQTVGTVAETKFVDNIPTSVFPNPAKNAVKISWADLAPRGIEIKVFDVQGNLRMDVKPDAGRNFIELNTSGLAPGTYIYQLNDPEKKVLSNGKFILQ